MRFIYDGQYRSFRGYVFAYGKPTTVVDKATQEACLKDSGFRVVTEEAKQEGGCPKCGKVFAKGQHLHNRACKA